MGGRRGKAGVLGVGVWVAVLAGVTGWGPGARGFVERIVQDSIDAQVADADLVIVGEPLDTAGPTDVGVRVLELIKGDVRRGESVRIDLHGFDPVMLKRGREALFVLKHKDGQGAGGSAYQVLGLTPLGIYVFESGMASAWELWDRSNPSPSGRIFRMDGRAVSSSRELLEAAREAARAGSVHKRESVALEGREFPPESPIARVKRGALRVPVDARLERMVLAWLDEPDVRYRARAAEVLAYFRTAASDRRLRGLVWDPGYQLVNAGSWEAERGRRVVRAYPARAAAARVLVYSGVPRDAVAVTAPHGAYRIVGWWKVVAAAVGVALVGAAWGRRGRWLPRAFVGCLVAAAAWVGVMGLRSRVGAESVGWAVGGASYEVVSSRGDVWLLRVADGAAAAGLAVRSEQVEEAPGLPWFFEMLDAKHGVAWRGFAAGRGAVHGADGGYQMVRLPHAAVAGLLLVIPGWAAAGWVWRKMRRRRRGRRGWCVACGYDLRGASSGRCPECGRAGAVRVNRAVGVMVVAVAVLMLGAGRARAQPEPAGDWQRPGWEQQLWSAPFDVLPIPRNGWIVDLEYSPPDPPWVFRDPEMKDVDPRREPARRPSNYDLGDGTRPDVSEAEALAWAAGDNVLRRAMGVEALARYPSEANERRVRAMLADPGFMVFRTVSWEARPEWRACRHYLVRRAAAETLWAWKGLSRRMPVDLPFTGPHLTRSRPPWGRWAIAACGAAVIVALVGRRGGVGLGRLMVGGSVVVIMVAAVLWWRSTWAYDTFDAAAGSAHYELSSGRGALWVMRARDGSAARGVRWCADEPWAGEAPWVARLAPFDVPSDGPWTWREAFEPATAEGRVGGAKGVVVGYRVVRVPFGLVMAAVALIPACAAVVRAWRVLRRWRRARGNRCVACGYDLRGSAEGGGRCPECGAYDGRREPRRRWWPCRRAGLAAVALALVFCADESRARTMLNSVESLELQFDTADLVVRGFTVADPGAGAAADPNGPVDVRIAEVLKNDGSVVGVGGGGTLRLALVTRREIPAGREGLFFLTPNAGAGILEGRGGGRGVSPLPRGGSRMRAYVPMVWVWQAGATSFEPADDGAYSMTDGVLTTPGALMAAAREAARFMREAGADVGERGRGGATKSPTVVYELVPWGKPGDSARSEILLVPRDARLERLTIAWLGQADDRYRWIAARVLAEFPSAENRRRLRDLLWDPAYRTFTPWGWPARRDERVVREYDVRSAASVALAGLGEASPADTKLPHGAYCSVAWGAVTVGVVGCAAVVALAGRRGWGGTGRRVVGWGLVVAAAWVATAAWRDRAAGRTLSWGVGVTSFELASCGGDVWLLGVQDGGADRSLAVRTELAADEDGRPWFASRLGPVLEKGLAGVYAAEGRVAGQSIRYQVVRVPAWAVVGLILAAPAWWAVRVALRAARRSRRLRGGRCVACGYDLRGAPASGRCPECGAAGRASPPPVGAGVACDGYGALIGGRSGLRGRC